jgi:type II secretory pathway component PulF
MATFQYQAQRPDGSIEKGVIVGTSLDAVAQQLAAKGLNVTQLGASQSFDDPVPSNFSRSARPQDPAPQPQPTPAPKRELPKRESIEEQRAATQRLLAEASRPTQPEGPLTEPRRNGPGAETNRQSSGRQSPSYQGERLPDRSYFETSVLGPLVGQVPLTDLAFFFRHAATMLDAGVGIVQTMNTLAVQARDPKLSSVIKEIARQVEAGHPISESMRRYPEAISGVVVSVLEAGERGGFLSEALATNAEYLEQEIELRNLYKKATFYPKLQLAASVVIIIAANIIITAIRPDAQKLSSPLTNPVTWVVLAPLLLATFLFFRVGLANPDIKSNWDQLTTKIPYLGKTLQQIAMARFGRSFAALYKAGVPLQTVLVLSANSCGNEHLKSLMLPAAAQLEQGYGVTETLAATNAFSPIILDMIHTGETTGNLDSMLQKSAEFYIEEAKVRQKQLGVTVGVCVSMLVAIYIGYIIINFYTNMGSGISSAYNSG